MRHICYWKPQFISEKIIDINETPQGVCFQCGKVSHLGKKLLLPWLPDSMLYKLDMQDSQNNDFWTFLKEGDMVFQGSCFMEEPARYSAEHRGKWLINFPHTSRTVLQISCFIDKSTRHSKPVSWRWMPQHFRATLCGCPVAKCLCCSVIVFPSWVFDGVEE